MISKKKTILAILLLAALLRLYKLNSIPVSLFGDELDVGYHAYSVLKTGKDYNGNFLPLHFQSLAEWRTPLYLYSVVPTVALFGISPLGVRLPAAIFGILSIFAFYKLVELTRQHYLKIDQKLEIYSALFLAISPWHIQYSRAAFEVTQMLFLIITGLYFFFFAIKNKGKYLWLAGVCLVLTPWVYSTAKLFIPIFLVILLLLWHKKLFSIPKKELTTTVVGMLIIGLPLVYTIFFGGGSQRFGYIGIFTDPTLEPEIGTARLIDAKARGELTAGLSPTVIDRAFHNKVVFWGTKIAGNYFQSLSFDFLFVSGDPNPRHSPNGVGQFYWIEAASLVLGVVGLYSSKTSKKIKLLVTAWILFGIFPASLTRDGGNHATRLILILPPLMLLISYGFTKLKYIPKIVYSGILFLGVIFYLHNFYVHNPTYSERWWHAGWSESIKEVKNIEENYEKVIITMADEPAWIFFAANYEYEPENWHENFPIGNDVVLDGFGKVSHIDKFYFGSPSGRGLYEWGQVLDAKTLYLASAKEVKVNLIMEPERTPSDLKLVKSIAYPSGEPAFFIFSGISPNDN